LTADTGVRQFIGQLLARIGQHDFRRLRRCAIGAAGRSGFVLRGKFGFGLFGFENDELYFDSKR